MNLTWTMVAAAAGIGSVHTLAPDHWVPFAALARAERWSPRRTALITGACGLGHVTVSVALGLLGLAFGLELLQAFGARLESVAGYLLIGFGLAYALWGLGRGHVHLLGSTHAHGGEAHAHLHAHGQAHHHDPHDARDDAHQHHHHHEPRRMTAWTLFVLFSLDPCVAVIPLMFAAVPLGWMSVLAVTGAYEAATLATMIAMVMPARLAANAVRARWADRWGDALAGVVIAAIGAAVMAAGI